MDTQAEAFSCTLQEPELLGRMQAWKQLASQAITRRVEGNRLVATFQKDPQLLRQVQELIAAEATCCAFLEFTLKDEPGLIVTELRLPDDVPDAARMLMLALLGHDR